ncbi:MAG: hypothetical protein J0H15_10640 [Xanthomonadales bacterium]|nr:hypothetical protein [Xanthomonadales bacterium]
MSIKSMSILAVALAFAFGGAGIHAEELSKSGKPLTAQQLRMKNCNAEARSNALKGDERKAFMSTCLKGAHAPVPVAAVEDDAAQAAPAETAPAVAKAPTARQLQRKACGEEAKAEGLKGDPRKEYVKECMKRPTPEVVG